ncbi:sensor histidine kinase [Hungatella hathewayi]|uniref:cache domain-containing sensor histidine kinase n=1 Tax=Hungatella TaxID=1649459 RepID=UPI000E43F0B8|nr:MULTISPECIES: sensor histidine kinase [Hungatella]RGO74589.1 sensor histidine kinase [Hungatella hathewayi]
MMKLLATKIKLLFSNTSLKRKILTIVLVSIFLISGVSLAGLQIVSNAYLKLLRNTIANNLSYSATTISYYLSNIETMSGLMLSDSNIQNNLADVRHSDNPRIRTEAYKNLSYTVLEYYQQYKPNFISYITLNNPDFITYSNFLGSRKTPEEIERTVLDAAQAADGRPVWISNYGKDHGIFMGRLIKNIQSSNLEELGTLLVSLDLEALMDSLNKDNSMYEDPQYYILTGDTIIYNDNPVSASIHDQRRKPSRQSYEIMTIDRHKYFVTEETIPGFDWTYVCYVSYDPIFQSVSFVRTLSICMIILSILSAIAFSESMISFISCHTRGLIRKMEVFSTDENAVIESDYDYSCRKDEFGLLNRQFDHMAEKIRNLIQVNYVNELWKKDAQLKALETQINPHFLYNTLESVNWRAQVAGNMEISSMVESLGTLLRATLSNSTSHFDLKKELGIVTAYITIQKYRFEDRLEYSIHCNEAWYNAQIPKMCIQPLVENSINYGLEESTELCTIEITIEHQPESGTLTVLVKNDGSLFEDHLLEKLRSQEIKPHGFGIGLININERIKLMFGKDYGLTLYNENDWAVARIIMPYITDQEGILC